MKCVYFKNFDNLLDMFGFNKNKIISEVERYLGKKLNKPAQESASQAAANP